MMHDRDRISAWFTLKSTTIEEKGIHHGDRYNMDENGFAMGLQGRLAVICSRKNKPITTQDGSRKWVTVIECISTTGRALPAFVIFKGKSVNKELQEMWDSAYGRIHFSENGWTNNETGLTWFKECF